MMTEVDIILNKAIEHISSRKIYNSFEDIYPFTTENISRYIDYFDLEDKSLLTVGSSSDQVINAILNNCRDITVIDINPYTKYYYYLKASAILSLNRMEYLEFFRYDSYPKVFSRNKLIFNENSFNKLKDNLYKLSKDAYIFWNTLFNTFDKFQIRENLFCRYEEFYYLIEKGNIYLNNNADYFNVREKINNIPITFINEDVLNFDFNRLYDNIWLSNICEYLTLEEIILILDKYSKLLKKDGKILLSYLYNDTFNGNSYFNSNCEYIIKKYNLFKYSFIGVYGLLNNNKNIKDSILVYQKRK